MQFSLHEEDLGSNLHNVEPLSNECKIHAPERSFSVKNRTADLL